jgi:hypothetical protein
MRPCSLQRVRLSRRYVKEAVLESLKRSNGRLTNGVASLHANPQVFDLLSWACTALPTTAHTIFAWHIATTICQEDNNMKTTYNHSHVSVACALSKYCAYLVVLGDTPRVAVGISIKFEDAI